MIATREANYHDIPMVAKIHVDTWRTTYQGIVPDEILASLSYKKREIAWHQVFDEASEVGGFTYVAESEPDQVVGFLNGSRERTGNQNYQGELNAIYILKSHQKKGVGRELVGLAAQRLSQMEIHSMLAWVLEANSACNFYESLGGKVIQRKYIERGGRKLSEIAYGWTDLFALFLKEPR